ncbi:MAG: PfkB family carbohydrate kinase [Dehalococcoidales bacterium]|nr:PfkB family carbohydrate kinase [Dehalococcoidales bacterium]
MTSVLVVGSVAFDDIETPFGLAHDTLGGSATYFSLAASTYGTVNLVAVVGEDFPARHVGTLQEKGVDTSGLQVREGKTFRWAGRYEYDLNTAHTLDTQLNVFADFHPHLPERYRDSGFVFLANIDPELQIEVLSQVPRAKLRVMDTMNFWIERRREHLTKAISLVDIVLMNEAEVRQFAGTYSLVAAARQVLALGPKALVVKKGEYGAVLFADSGYFAAPAYPLEEVKDPTGAGDSFAGGFVGYLSSVSEITDDAIRRAIVHGSVIASFTVEDFGVGRLVSLTSEEVSVRYREIRRFTYCEDV